MSMPTNPAMQADELADVITISAKPFFYEEILT